MDKGDFRFKAWTGNLREDSPFPCGSGNHLRRSRGSRLGWLWRLRRHGRSQGGYAAAFVQDSDDRQCDLGLGRYLVGFVVPDLDRIVRSATVLRVQHQQVGDVGLLPARIDFPSRTPQNRANELHSLHGLLESRLAWITGSWVRVRMLG